MVATVRAGSGTNRYGPDARKLFVAQGVRAFGYGFGAVLLGTSLRGSWSAGVAGRDRVGRHGGWHGGDVGARRPLRRSGGEAPLVRVALCAARRVSVSCSPFTGSVWVLAVAALTGVMSTEVIESGPFTSLEQPMLAADPRRAPVHGFGVYNAVAAVAGSFGALAAAVPELVGSAEPTRWFVVFVPLAIVGWLVARSLSAAVEPTSPPAARSVCSGRGRR